MFQSVLLSILLIFVGVTDCNGFTGDISDAQFRISVLKRLDEMEKNEELLKNNMRTLEGQLLMKDSRIDELDQTVITLTEQVAKLDFGLDRSTRQFVNGFLAPHIAFTAYLDHPVHYDIVPNSDSHIVFNKVLLNDANAYNNVTGVFTAPATGVYLFSYAVGAKNITQANLTQFDIFTELVVDGTRQLSSVAESTKHYDDEQGSTTMVIFVQEGSQVWVKHVHLGGHSVYSIETSRLTSFTGVLLYLHTQ